MKKLNLLGILALAVFMIGCAPSKTQKKSRIISRGAGAVTQPLVQAPQNGSHADKDGQAGAWGEILALQSQQQFEFEVRKFLSNITEPDGSPISVGNISGMTGQSTGIRFWGSVGLNTQNGVINVNGQNNAQIASQGSVLRMSIIDSYVGLQNAEGETITEIPIYIAQNVEGFVGVTGVVQGNRAQIHYQDSFGRITLDGTFNSHWFQGTVYYQNTSPQASGTLGRFAVTTCGFFKCQ